MFQVNVTPCSTVSIVNFEHVITDWDTTNETFYLL